MIIRAVLLSIVAATAPLAGCTSAPHAAHGHDAAVAGARTPQEAADRFYAALQAIFRGDAAPMGDAWWHDGDTTYMGPGGDFRIGWDAIAKEWAAQAGQKLGGKVEPTRMHWAESDSIALLTCVEVGTNEVNGKRESVEIRSSTAFRKRDGVWKAISHQTDTLGYIDRKG